MPQLFRIGNAVKDNMCFYKFVVFPQYSFETLIVLKQQFWRYDLLIGLITQYDSVVTLPFGGLDCNNISFSRDQPADVNLPFLTTIHPE